MPLALSVTAEAAAPAFTPPLHLAGGGAEPSIRNAPAGQRDPAAAYISAPTGLGSNFWRVDELTNPDGTHSFKGSPPQQPDLGTGGGDSEISVGQVDPATGCSAIAYSGLHNIDLLDNFTVARSTDCGRSFDLLNPYATQHTLTDRQWQTFDGVKTNHLIYHKVDTGQIVDSLSSDGGQTYVSLSPGGATGIIDAAHSFTLPQNQIGNVVTDYSRPVTGQHYLISGEQTHTLYAIFGGPRDAIDASMSQTDSGYNHVDTVYLAKSTDGGLTWTDSTIFSTPPTARRELNMLFPVIAVDSTGGLYAAWSDTYKVQYASSKDGGATWSKPYQVNTDNAGATPDAGRADIFPWIAGGGTGKLDVVWYHGEGGNTSFYRNPGTNDATNGVTTWTVAFAQLFNATNKSSKTGAAAPSVKAYSTAVTPPMHKGSICLNGTLCDVPAPGLEGDRTLLDFFQVSIDPAGLANIAYADDYATPGTASTTYTRQNGGLSAITGKSVTAVNFVPLPVPTGTSCPGPQVLDSAGDAHGSAQVGANASNVETFDILSMGFDTPDATHLGVTLKLTNLSELPAAGTVSSLWYGYFAIGATTYYVSATSNGPGLQSYSVGTFAAGKYTSTGTPVGVFTPGPNGTIHWIVDRANLGNAANGSVASGPYADDHGAFQVAGNGLRYTAPVDVAPDSGSGAPYTIGGAC